MINIQQFFSREFMGQYLTNESQITSMGLALFVILMIWSLVWKGLALWKSAQLGKKWWFVALLLVNTLGILEMLYIFVFSKIKKEIK
ncbi:MAG: DUF5652 family protein [Candidatus Paceibacterota bacterium]|jgi:hypothetical protein